MMAMVIMAMMIVLVMMIIVQQVLRQEDSVCQHSGETFHKLTDCYQPKASCRKLNPS
jgi:competence protein ComGC